MNEDPIPAIAGSALFPTIAGWAPFSRSSRWEPSFSCQLRSCSRGAATTTPDHQSQ